MNAVGRQRSSASTAQHQRQFSDNFLDTSSNGRWLQSAGLQHLQSSNSAVPPFQDFGYYDGSGQGSRMYRSIKEQKTYGGSSDLFVESLSPPEHLQRKSDEDHISQNEYIPGLLDLHSLDSELLTEMPESIYNGPSLNNLPRGRSFNDSEQFYGNNKASARAPDSDVLKNLVEGAKASNVAKIKVVVRKRPLNKKELARNEEDIIETYSNSLVVHEMKLKVDLTEYVEKHAFVFDAVLDEEVSNDEVYHETVEPIVPIIFQRTKATCFAYGQTGSGKTYTMKPLPLKAVRDILRVINHTYKGQGFQLFVSFFEIYGGKLFDLLSERKKLCMREDGKQQVCIVGLQEYQVSDVEMVKELIEIGNATRSTGTTGANEESSRSHAILQLTIKKGGESKPAKLVGKLSFIDLAGSERGADTTDNDKQTRMEGAEINKSLLALKECIRALDNDKLHIPFRGSKLTEVLRDSFVGNSHTVMISCISPNSGSCEHTLNTLRYADRVKSLSKGNNSKRDILSSTMNLKESTTQTLSKFLSPASTLLGDTSDLWLEQTEMEENEDFSDPEKPSWKNTKIEPYTYNTDDKIKTATGQAKLTETYKAEIQPSDANENLNLLLKEEESLVNAHRKQVEETMNIVQEEMKLLVSADRPGNHLDDYISRLNSILSQKASGILQLQDHLSRFQKRLKDHGVLITSDYQL
ncbi:kinesin-like protein KIN-13B isoform X1 [Andrographis paniculata]|uniref:kinesin-like protein KIN-13B isoform X1 n=1 Tax=Andrographis paniculata TaxID=175694 RepID=UPI0021E758A1|nr:kinesin-like protein KIN-13B isoform X1 [Andrographis paniculata]